MYTIKKALLRSQHAGKFRGSTRFVNEHLGFLSVRARKGVEEEEEEEEGVTYEDQLSSDFSQDKGGRKDIRKGKSLSGKRRRRMGGEGKGREETKTF